LLATIDPRLQLFGAATHEYQLAPPLTDDELASLEAALGPLPDEYRAFVRTLAAHGAGPYYGLVEPYPPDEARDAVMPSPAREFLWGQPAAGDAACPAGAHVLDGTLVLADQGCGGRSLLIVRGPRAGEIWSDWTRDAGHVSPEAPSFAAWYARWIDRTLLEWCAQAAPRIALDGPSSPEELEAIGLSYELVDRAGDHPAMLRTLGYLHLRERRFADAERAFERAAAATAGSAGSPAASGSPAAPDASAASSSSSGGSSSGGSPSGGSSSGGSSSGGSSSGGSSRSPAVPSSSAVAHARSCFALDRARVALVRDDTAAAISHAHDGLGIAGLWYSTRDELRDVLERALGAAGRHDDALVVLDQRAAERHFSFELHHRLARERLARHDVDGAGAALERAARMAHILGHRSPLEARVPASFDPIIAELRAAGRSVDADALAARAARILDAS
jgi:hypothetical protein